MNKQLYTYLQSQNNTPLIFLHQEMLKKKEKKIKETFFFSLSVSQSDPSRPQSCSSFNLITLFDWLKIQTKHTEAILLYSYKVHNHMQPPIVKIKQSGCDEPQPERRAGPFNSARNILRGGFLLGKVAALVEHQVWNIVKNNHQD